MTDMQWNDQTEDWPKTSWDFWYQDGSGPVDKLEDLAPMLGRSISDTVELLLHNEFGKAAPPELIEEARARASA